METQMSDTALSDTIIECFNDINLTHSVHGDYKTSIVHGHGTYRFVMDDTFTGKNLARALVNSADLTCKISLSLNTLCEVEIGHIVLAFQEILSEHTLILSFF